MKTSKDFLCSLNTSLALILALPLILSASIRESGALFLYLPPDSRILAIGRGTVALPSGPGDTWSNPAASVYLGTIHLGTSYTKWMPDFPYDLNIKYLVLGGTLPMSPLKLGGQISFLYFDKGEYVRSNGNDLALNLNVSGNYKMEHQFELNGGINLKFIHSENNNDIAVDIGLLISGLGQDMCYKQENGEPSGVLTLTPKGTPPGLSFGLSIRNLGPDINGEPLPRVLSLGLGLKPLDTEIIQCQGTFQTDIDLVKGERDIIYSVGLEGSIVRMSGFRLGYYNDKNGHIDYISYGFFIGLPFIQVEFSHIPKKHNLTLSNTISFSLRAQIK